MLGVCAGDLDGPSQAVVSVMASSVRERKRVSTFFEKESLFLQTTVTFPIVGYPGNIRSCELSPGPCHAW